MRFSLILVLVATFTLLPACAKKSTSSGPVSIQEQNGVRQVTVKGSEGTTQIGEGVVDPNTLGLPVYPGAVPSKGGSFSSHTKQGGAQIVTIETNDPFEKVYAFYKANMPPGSEKMKVGQSMATFQVSSGKDSSRKGVSVATYQGKTEITLIVTGP